MAIRKYKLKNADKQIGILTIDGERIWQLKNSSIELFEDLDPENYDTLWFPDYKKGRRIFNNEYTKDFIQYRASERSRPQLFQRMEEAGIPEYDELLLFLYAKGQFQTDKLNIEEIK